LSEQGLFGDVKASNQQAAVQAVNQGRRDRSQQPPRYRTLFVMADDDQICCDLCGHIDNARHWIASPQHGPVGKTKSGEAGTAFVEDILKGLSAVLRNVGYASIRGEWDV
jgi:hypothetical protein